MHASNLTCICYIINPPPLKVIGAGLTTKNMSSISLNLLTNSTLEAQNPRRDTSIPTVIAGLLPTGRLPHPVYVRQGTALPTMSMQSQV